MACLDWVEGSVYETFFLEKFYQKSIIPHIDMLQKLEDSHNLTIEELFKVKGLRELHTTLHTRMFKHNSLEDYVNTLKITDEHVENVKTPLLCLHAKDDPIAAHTAVPTKKIEQNPNMILAETAHGAHICWFEGLNPKRWYP